MYPCADSFRRLFPPTLSGRCSLLSILSSAYFARTTTGVPRRRQRAPLVDLYHEAAGHQLETAHAIRNVPLALQGSRKREVARAKRSTHAAKRWPAQISRSTCRRSLLTPFPLSAHTAATIRMQSTHPLSRHACEKASIYMQAAHMPARGKGR
eukprot:714354-Pleurochrysis_carterae.AAC.1